MRLGKDTQWKITAARTANRHAHHCV